MQSLLARTLDQQIRSILATHWISNVRGMTEKEVGRAFDHLVHRQLLSTMTEIEIAISHYLELAGSRKHLIDIYENAVDLLSFKTMKDSVVLYSGQYELAAANTTSSRARVPAKQGTDTEQAARGADAIIKMYRAAQEHARKHHKVTIGQTEGGRWLEARKFESFVGKAEEDAFWRKGSLKLVELLQGEVEVFLAYPDPASVYRTIEGHALFRNPAVTRVTYHLEHGRAAGSSADFKALEKGVERDFRGKKLVFMVPA
jgi:hypothetical protein